jgi:hypothetical protein
MGFQNQAESIDFDLNIDAWMHGFYELWPFLSALNLMQICLNLLIL